MKDANVMFDKKVNMKEIGDCLSDKSTNRVKDVAKEVLLRRPSVVGRSAFCHVAVIVGATSELAFLLIMVQAGGGTL